MATPGETRADAAAVTPDAAAVTPDAAAGTQRSISRRRLVLVDVLIWVTTVLAIVAIFAVWANRQVFNPTNWANTSTQFLQDPKVRSATANYAVDQLYANVDVAGLIKSGLPPQLQGLAAPAAGALRNAAVQGAELALSRPRIQALWAKANLAAAKTFVAIVDGGKGPLAVNGGRVTLNLAAIVNQIAARLGLPANIGSKLPPSIANLTVLKSNQLKFVQDGGKAVKGLALALTIIVPLLYALAVALAKGHRRRTLMSVGFAIIVAGLVGFLTRRILTTQVTASLVSDNSVRPAVYDVVRIGTGMLAEIAGAFVAVGAVIVLAAFFAGPARWMTAARRAITPFLRDHPDRAFALTAAVMVLIFIWQPIPATGKLAGMITFMALALFGTAMLRRQVVVEFPDARHGEAMAAIRERRGHGGVQPAGNGSIPGQLEQLARLHERGSITDDEYISAKASLLGSTAEHASAN